MKNNPICVFGFCMWIRTAALAALALSLVLMLLAGAHGTGPAAVGAFGPWVIGLAMLTYLAFKRPAFVAYERYLEYRPHPFAAARVVALRKIASIHLDRRSAVLTARGSERALSIPLRRVNRHQELVDYFVDTRIGLRLAHLKGMEQASGAPSTAENWFTPADLTRAGSCQ
jgi:hypothetical protein